MGEGWGFPFPRIDPVWRGMFLAAVLGRATGRVGEEEEKYGEAKAIEAVK